MKLNKLVKKYLKNKQTGYLSKDQKNDDLKRYIRLDLGENLVANPSILKEIGSIDKETLVYYADPSNSQIKKTIAEIYTLSSKNIMIANSSNEIIDLISRMLINKKDNVLIVVPTFFRYIDASLKAGGKIIKVYLKEEDHYIPTEDIVEQICKVSIEMRPKIIWLCNPNNPTGEIYKSEDIEKIVKISDGLVVVDEAFYEYYDLKNKGSAVNLINKYPNLLVLRTLSKAYGLAGLRLGYSLGHPKTISIIENYHDTLLMGSNLVVQLASKALSDRKYLTRSIEEIRRQKIWLESTIAKLKNLEIGADTKANVYILRHKKKDLYQELLKHNILTADFRNTEGLEKLGYVRITIGDQINNQLLIKALKEIN